MKRYIGIASFMSIVLFCQCNKTEYLQPGFTEENSANIQACQNSSLSDSTNIIQNLIGEWKLVGYSCSLCETAPKINLNLTHGKGTLDFKDARDENILLEFEWTLEKASFFSIENVKYHFRAEPNHFALEINAFCDKYMYFEGSAFSQASEASVVLYEKQ